VAGRPARSGKALQPLFSALTAAFESFCFELARVFFTPVPLSWVSESSGAALHYDRSLKLWYHTVPPDFRPRDT